MEISSISASAENISRLQTSIGITTSMIKMNAEQQKGLSDILAQSIQQPVVKPPTSTKQGSSFSIYA